MKVNIHPSAVQGVIHAPASKSSMQRACAAALLYKGETTILNPGKSNDDLAALDIIQKLGATIKIHDNEKLVISSQGINTNTHEINCGESGLSARLFTSIAALSNKAITISGTGSLLTRPMDFFDEIFPQLHVKTTSQNGKLPLQVQGPLIPENITIDASLSSQFLTGLLMVYGAVATNKSITVKNLVSQPYIDLTLKIMNEFGVNVDNQNYEKFHFSNPQTKDQHTIYTVEGDWSNAAFLLVAGAVAGKITVTGLDVFSTQADKNILQALMAANAIVSIEEKQITVSKNNLQAFHFNATHCPDLFPPLVALAACCKGKTVIEGANRLRHKESNRALTLQTEFAKMGVTISLQDNLMIIEGATKIKGAVVDSHNDHRIAMACAITALSAADKVIIENAEAVNKSYPDFFDHLKLLGIQINFV